MSVYYSLCLVTVRTKVPQNGRLVRFSKPTDCWCGFSWSICKQNGHCVGCIQSSSSQVYDGIHKSWEDIIGERNSGRKPKLSERDRHDWRELFLKITELLQQRWQQNSAFIFKILLPRKQFDESFTNPTSTVELQLLKPDYWKPHIMGKRYWWR